MRFYKETGVYMYYLCTRKLLRTVRQQADTHYLQRASLSLHSQNNFHNYDKERKVTTSDSSEY